jgi:lysophospholipase L1-like esterase
MGRGEHPIATTLGWAAASLAVIALWTPGARADWSSAPVVPKLGASTDKVLVSTFRTGQKLGNRPDVFAKVGDSISQSPAFLQGLGCGQSKLGRYSGLRRTIAFFATDRLPGDSRECGARVNSFSRNSAATLFQVPSSWAINPGGAVDTACDGTETPVACEVRRDRPAYAVILLGTNDVTRQLSQGDDPLPEYIANVGRLISVTRRLGVIPILNTIPPRAESAAETSTEEANSELWQLAVDRHVPLINLWRALFPLPNHGLFSDGLHLSVSGWPGCASPCNPNNCDPNCRAANFTPAGLAYGSDMRNLITVRTLRVVSRAATAHRR